MKKLIFAALLALGVPTPVAAEPITATIAAINTFAAASAVNAFIVRIATSMVLSALSAALKSKPRAPGIKTEAATTGGSNPQAFILGRYATGGNLAAPPYSAPNSGKTPNKFLTYVIDLSDAPGVTLSRLIVNNEYVTDLAASAGDHALEGLVIDGKPHVYLTLYDGTQTAADPYMLANFGADPDRPWLADMVGTGLAYAVVTFRYNREVFNGLPAVRFEVDGVPLYDPRADSTVGGSGAQRWNDPATWAQTDNPAVMIYNILRGVTLPDGSVWGGAVAAEDIPLESLFAAANECDQTVALAGGGTEPQFRAGFEVAVDDEPAAVIEELLKACAGEICEFGGVYKLRVGPPALPVYVFSDDDISADDPQRLVPYPGLDGVQNAIHATHPAPAALWETHDAPPIYDPALEAEDNGRRLVAEVQLPAVASDTQVQRLMAAWIKDNRRFRRHGLTLPPEAAFIEPLDTVAWTSARNGYVAKLFEVAEVSDAPQTLFQTVAIRERDPADNEWSAGVDEVAVVYPSAASAGAGTATVADWAVSALSVIDATGAARRPGLLLAWDGADTEPGQSLEYEVRPLGQTALVAQGVAADVAAGQVVVTAGIVAGVAYEARGRVVSEFPADWSAWGGATAPDLFVATDDIADNAVTSGVIDSTEVEGNTTKTLALTCYGGAPVAVWVNGLLFAADDPGSGASLTVKWNGVTIASKSIGRQDDAVVVINAAAVSVAGANSLQVVLSKNNGGDRAYFYSATALELKK